ncbi:MAG: hypothetical protein ACRD96_11570, partial [Bryobacteraceae bacterium]
PMFRYSPAQLARMRNEIAKRSATLQELSPWPDINYMVDESWARIHPYASEAAAGETVELQLRFQNHASGRVTNRVRWNVPPGWTLLEAQTTATVEGRQEGSARARLRAGSAGLHVVTVDISFSGRVLKQWTEAMVRVR